MDNEQLARIFKVLKPLVLAYPNLKITKDTLDLYARALSDIDFGALNAAVLKCINTCDYFPSIARIRAEATNMIQTVTDTKIKSPDEAWDEVLKQMQETAFTTKKPLFSTPEIEQAARSMGWVNLCETKTDDIGVARGQFLKLYDAACKRRKEKSIDGEVLRRLEANGIVFIPGNMNLPGSLTSTGRQTT